MTNMSKLALLVVSFVIILLIVGLKMLSNDVEVDLDELPLKVVTKECVVKTEHGNSVILYKDEKVKVIKRIPFKGHEVMRLFNNTKCFLKDLESLRDATEYEQNQYEDIKIIEDAIKNGMVIEEEGPE